MRTATQRPRLLLAASLLCTFSLVGVIGYHVTPSSASAAGSIPGFGPATEAEIEVFRARHRAAREARGVDASTPAEEPGYTLNPHGPGLVPTEAPGTFADPVDTPLSDAAAATSPLRLLDNQAPFTMPGSRRPASAGSRQK